jgi:hypothetical protein
VSGDAATIGLVNVAADAVARGVHADTAIRIATTRRTAAGIDGRSGCIDGMGEWSRGSL